MTKTETKKMIFAEDKFVNGELLYNHGEVVEVPVESVDRWLIRGGKLVEEGHEDEAKLEALKESDEDGEELLQKTFEAEHVGEKEVESEEEKETKKKKSQSHAHRHNKKK